jgi:hypothetical protein
MANLSGNYQRDHQHLYNRSILKKNFIELSLRLMLSYCAKFLMFHIQMILELKTEENKLPNKPQKLKYSSSYLAIS